MRFLRTVFGVGENHRMFQPDVLRWKCLAPHPWWNGGRGYALRYKGEIAAFGCVVPCRFMTGAGPVASCDVIDWAASRTVPGAGLMLYRHIQGLAGTMINIGGTPEARAALPGIGFRQRAELHHYTRVVRPWRQFQQTEHKDWKSPLRLARDLGELVRTPGAQDSLAVRRVTSFEDAAWNYFMACPAAAMEGYLLEREGAPVGAFLLSRVGDECRIADLRINGDWAGAYRAAVAAASKVTRIVAAASVPARTGALEAAGFRRTHSEPVFVLDPESRLPAELSVSLLENDGFYWHSQG